MEPQMQAYLATQPESALCADWNEYLATAGWVNRHIAWHISLWPWSCSVCWFPGWMDWLAEINTDLWEVVAH